MVMSEVTTQNMFIKRPAFSLIEIVVVLFLIVVIVPAINNVLSQSVRAMGSMQREVEALYLAQEGMEVVRAIRDESWDAFVLQDGQKYLNNLSNPPTLSQSSNLIDDKYQRIVLIEQLWRDSNGELTTQSAGNTLADARLVTVTVQWTEFGQTQSVELKTYLTNFTTLIGA